MNLHAYHRLPAPSLILLSPTPFSTLYSSLSQSLEVPWTGYTVAPKHTFAFIVLCAPSLHSLFPRSTVVKLSGSELLDKKSEVAPTDKGIFF